MVRDEGREERPTEVATGALTEGKLQAATAGCSKERREGILGPRQTYVMITAQLRWMGSMFLWISACIVDITNKESPIEGPQHLPSSCRPSSLQRTPTGH